MRSFRTAAILVSLCASGAAYANSPGWTISESSGSVSVLQSGLNNASLSRIAIKGSKVAEGDIIATGKTGRAVIVRGEEYVIVAPGSRLRIVDTAEETTLTQFFQSVGNSIFKIKKKTTPHFGVQTPFLAAVVKGTTFSVTVTDSGAAVQVTEGRVQVSTLDGAASHLVVPGEIGLVSQAMPYRLTVQGMETKVIDSPNRSISKPKTDASEPAASSADEASGFEGSVTVTVGEGPVQLESVTGGLVSGNSTLVSTVSSTSKLALIEQPKPQSVSNVDVAPPIQVVATVEMVDTPLPPVDAPPGVTALPPSPVVEANEEVTALPPTPIDKPVGDVQDVVDASSSKPVGVVSSLPSTAPPTSVDSIVSDAPIVAMAGEAVPNQTIANNNASAPVNGQNQGNAFGNQPTGPDQSDGNNRRSIGGRGGQFWQNGGGNGRGGNQ